MTNGRTDIPQPRATRLRLLPLIVGAIIAVCTGCDSPSGIPGRFFTVSPEGWKYGDTLFYNAGHDTVGNIDRLVLSVRHSDDYPYANLWVELSYENSDTLVADTFNVVLADAYGKWLGSGSGPVRMLCDTVHPRHTPAVDARFGLRHIMRVDAVPDIEQIGITPITNTDLQ